MSGKVSGRKSGSGKEDRERERTEKRLHLVDSA